MSTFERTWRKLIASKEYREEFALAMLKQMIPFQTRAIRKKRGLSQAQLAQDARLTQGVISRAEDPNYGNLTLNTIGRIAAGFDLAFIGTFVPFSRLVRFSHNLSEEQFEELLTCVQENEVLESGRDLEGEVTESPSPLAAGATNQDAKLVKMSPQRAGQFGAGISQQLA